MYNWSAKRIDVSNDKMTNDQTLAKHYKPHA